MSIIIEYNPNLGNGTGAFITPKNDILLTHGDHEPFAYKYCTGIDVNNPNTSSEPFVNSKLTKEQLQLYKLWLKEREHKLRKLQSDVDFLVLVLGYDKVEALINETITTSSRRPHIRYYNYYLMDWVIYETPTLIYNPETGLFEKNEPSEFFMLYDQDREAEEEINEIKSRVLKKDRHYFFK